MFKLSIYGKKVVNCFFRVFSKMVKDTKLEILGLFSFLMIYLSNDISHVKLVQNFVISTCLTYVDIFLKLSILSKIIIDTGLKIFTKTALAQRTTLAMDASLVTARHLYQVNGKTVPPGESQVV